MEKERVWTCCRDSRCLICWAVVKVGGGNISCGNSSSKPTRRTIPHLPIEQRKRRRRKSQVSLEAPLWYISKCQLQNRARKKVISLWLLHYFSTCFCHTEIQPKPLQAQDFTQAPQCLATDTELLVKNTLTSLAACSVRTASCSSCRTDKYKWKETADGRRERVNTLKLKEWQI